MLWASFKKKIDSLIPEWILWLGQYKHTDDDDLNAFIGKFIEIIFPGQPKPFFFGIRRIIIVSWLFTKKIKLTFFPLFSSIFLLLCDRYYTALPEDPEFTDVIENITVPAGRNIKLACSVKNLGSYKVKIKKLSKLVWCQQIRFDFRRRTWFLVVDVRRRDFSLDIQRCSKLQCDNGEHT